MYPIRRLDLGFFVRPASETGGTEPRVEPVLAYLVQRPEGLLLFDTGIGAGEPETEAHYRPVRRPLPEALAAVGVSVADIDLVVNCHLHFDHCGGNPLLAGVPVVVQATELAAARAGGHTIDALVDFPAADYRVLDGEAEVWPGVWVLPTPGHTEGHQSLLVERPGGRSALLAGQAYDSASEYGRAALARRAALDGVAPPLPSYPAWLDRVERFAPHRVLFAHDLALWERLG
ncbi:N-acyl homoserine lactonase family protein [Streptomyces rubellomurinus]|uniref:Beta-lactamase n=2 Tax=Streptomyces TaxID=1883 RepID=A0A0F2T709_STRR3|nr:N-acyl homoserine lactonase family protein [Streptomyces rubellomurinus]KJS54130.1 beta-lactamase [Streptomyces rubellomurinus subsp. indigoferus]KJS58206.1 beta-lactamase [Streptomyces rubellomurinus]